MTRRASLPPSPLSTPLEDMKIRWDGHRPAKGGMQSLDSPRFGMTRSGGAAPHQGVDLAAPPGTPIFAIAEGVVEKVRSDDPNYGIDLLLKFRPAHAWVKYLASGGTVDDDGVLFAQYAHLTPVVVKNNQKIARGQFLGTTGVTGNADQKYPHLHFEIRKVRWPGTGKDGLSNRIDPESIFRLDFIEPFDALDRLGRTA